MPPKTKSETARDFFLHLLSIVTLYLIAAGMLTVLFQFVNHFFPDTASYSGGVSQGAVQFAIALLIPVVPMYAWTYRRLHAIYAKSEASAKSHVRKWLSNLTLFVAALVLIGDLVALIGNYLDGGLTIQVFLKIFIVFVVIGSIFLLYLQDAKPIMKEKLFFLWRMKLLLVIAICVVGAFFIIDSPQVQREQRIDRQTEADLYDVQQGIFNSYEQSGVLPKEIKDIPDGVTYRVVNTDSFVLCASFLQASDSEFNQRPRTVFEEDVHNWDHEESGEQCFDRTIPKYIRDNSKPVVNTTPTIPLEDISFKNVYSSPYDKYVYEGSVPLEDLEAHCTYLKGEFNTCGSSCAPDAEICTRECALTCEVK